MTRSSLMWRAFAAVGLTTVALVGCGSNGGGTSAGSSPSSAPTGTPRTVEVEMRDIAFSPDKLDVEAGETVRFVFHNTGKIAHDAFVGDQAAQEDHEMEMRQAGSNDMSGMSHGSSDAEGGITVDPGETKELTHTFTSGDGALIGCHQVGHYAAGMKININTN